MLLFEHCAFILSSKTGSCDGVPSLAKMLHKGMQCFAGLLVEVMQVKLHARSRVSTLKVGHKLPTNFLTRKNEGLRETHEPRPSMVDQGHMKVVQHHFFVPNDDEYRVGVDLEDLIRIDGRTSPKDGGGTCVATPTPPSEVRAWTPCT
jgi:hypothetical protein